MSDRKKRCTKCGEWKPATTEYFGVVKSHGRTRTLDGRLNLRGHCKACRQPVTYEHTQYKAKLQRARNRAYQRLGDLNPEGLALLYREELAREGIDPDTVKTTLLDRVRREEEQRTGNR